jgi:DNA-binding NarL/FixJ family response regulator
MGRWNMIRVVIACDIRLYREGLLTHLAKQEPLGVVGSASTVEETYRVARELVPDVLLLDMAMPDSLAIVQELRRIIPETRVVALAIPEVEHAVIACAEAGVSGFVTREASVADLLNAIVSVAHGEAAVSPRMAATLLRRVGTLAAGRAPARTHAELTLREREIVRLIDEGLSNKEIATRLNVETATVKNHVHNILDKLQVHQRGKIAACLRHAPVESPARREVNSGGGQSTPSPRQPERPTQLNPLERDKPPHGDGLEVVSRPGRRLPGRHEGTDWERSSR